MLTEAIVLIILGIWLLVGNHLTDLEILEGVDIPHDLHEDYLGLLAELKQTEDDLNEKVDSILSLIQSRKRWLGAIRLGQSCF